MSAAPSRTDVEDFLYAEAALLDEWRLAEWFDLFAEGAVYQAPTAGAPEDDDPNTSLFYIADDYVRLRERIERLKKKEAHAEFPRSRVRHMISNVRVLSSDNASSKVTCNFVVYRSKNGKVDTYYGHNLYTLDWSGEAWKIASKRVVLDMDMLYPGKISIVL
ncbi:MAG TPA: aromatic-ring-hydroxylating dioxygenase subunit beta [Caulobacteraceae bacterium]|jgi:p-cumate 2,3-dioxygenase beta subunit|nr:aromatic-ring-hydroxylating dioxygenase subunit beta [Caulobacteraceae bacterium]